MSESKMKCKIVTFKDVYKMVEKIAEDVKISGYKVDTVIGLARGGWIPARLICDFLGITDLVSLKVEHWIQTGKTKDEATIKYPLTMDFSKKRLLVVDDVADTGKSLITSIEYLKRLKPKEIRVATMQYIPQSRLRPDYFAEELVWIWLIYPWNWVEDMSTLLVRLLRQNRKKRWNLGEIKVGLWKNFEIRCSEEKLRYILKAMEERKQLESFRKPVDVEYKLKKEKVIEL